MCSIILRLGQEEKYSEYQNEKSIIINNKFVQAYIHYFRKCDSASLEHYGIVPIMTPENDLRTLLK